MAKDSNSPLIETYLDALWLEKDGVRVETVNGGRGNRPWVVRPRPWKSAP